MEQNAVSLEISGPTAMWTRPDTGDAPVSYPIPTYSAVKGIFECILWSQWAEVVPIKAEICKPIIYHYYVTNYRGPLRKAKIMGTGDSYQLLATVLVNVCYRLYAELHPEPEGYNKHGRPGQQEIGTTNGVHAYQEMFERRLRNGQLHYTPCLGSKEFTPDYVGRFRPETTVQREINLKIPSMLRSCFPNGKRSEWKPVFDYPVEIKDGELWYVK
jgi:CRISPR-associated protein Cas5d